MEYLWIGFLVIALALRVGLVIWAYKVGERKGKGTTGLLLGLFLGWIGLIVIYAITTDSSPPSSSTSSTPTSYSPPSPSSASTTTGGTSTSGTIQCKHCSRKAPADARFCPYCGHLLYD